MFFKNRRTSLAMKLLVGSALSSAAVTAAYAQDNTVAPETVVVTGTSIRGSAPVGANLTTVGQAAIQNTMQPTVQSLLSDIPELGNFGSAGVSQQNSDRGGGFSPTIHNVGAGSSIATLSLVNGHRIPGTGTTESNNDPTIIASSALERVEILADGASAIYGSDAVVGVVNFITRQNFRGMELNVQDGIADHYNTFDGSSVFGTGWNTGSVMLAYNYSSKSDLMNQSRSFVTARQDIRLGATDPSLFTSLPTLPAGQMTVTPAAGPGTTGPFGVAIPYPSKGQNFQNFSCPVATIATNSSSAAAFYYQPSGGYGGPSFSTSTTNNPGNGACDTLSSGALLPSETRNNVFVQFKQLITDSLSLETTLSFATRIDYTPMSRGTVQSTVFGPGNLNAAGTALVAGAPAPAVGSVNPFYVGNATTGTQAELIRYSFDSLLGPGAFDKVYMNDVDINADLTWDLGSGRELTFGGVAGVNYNQQHDGGQVSQGEALLALNGSTNASGIPSNSLPDPFGLASTYPGSRVLTTLTALDVWDPAGATNKTSAAVIKSLKDGGFAQDSNQTIQDFDVKFDGPVFDLPAGPVKVAVGGEFLHTTMEEGGTNVTAGGAAFSTSSAYYFRTGRTVYSAFAELNVPIVGEDMNVPLMKRLDLDVSGRYDRYSDFGDTENPKVGLDWLVTDGLKARASFGTSFVAPGLHDALGNNSQSIVGAAGTPSNNVIAFGAPNTFNGGAGTAGTWVATPQGCAAGGGTVVNSAFQPLTQTAAGATVAGAFACQVKFGATNGAGTSAGFSIAGGHLGLQPAHGRSYTLGVDINGSAFGIDGLTASVTYWQTTYSGLITGGGAVHPSLTFFAPCPDPVNNCGATPTSAFVANFLAGRSLGIAIPSTVWETVDNRLNNSFDIWMNGLDFNTAYVLHTDDLGSFKATLAGTETLRYSQSPHVIGGVTAEAVVVDAKDGRNSPRYGGASDELSFRTTVGWQFENYGLTFGMNFIQPQLGTDNSFPYSLSGPGRGQIIPATGVFQSSGFIHIGALKLFDLLGTYQVPKGFLGIPDNLSDGAQVSLKISDLFDNYAPFTPGSSSALSGGNPVGRMFTVGIRKNF